MTMHIQLTFVNSFNHYRHCPIEIADIQNNSKFGSIHYLPRGFLKLHASRWRIFKSPRYPPPWSAGGLLVESRWIVGDMPTNANCRWSADRNREKSVEGRQSRKAGGVTAIVKSSWCVDEIEVSTSLGDNRVYVREAEFFLFSINTHRGFLIF